MKTKILGLVIVIAFSLVSCGKGSKNLAQLGDQEQEIIGHLVDSGIEGLTYKVSDGQTGLTGAGGAFKCAKGSTVTFHLGAVQLGDSVGCQEQPITPVELFASTKDGYKNDERVTGALVLLQSLDSDQLHDNGIKIDQTVLEGFKNLAEDTSFDDIDQLKDAFKKAYPSRELISEKEAVENFSKTLEAIDSGEYSLIEDNKDDGKEEEDDEGGKEEEKKDSDKVREFTFSTIKSPVTGRIWMDRNLGAKRACKTYNDEQCYGDYYQWGRNADGHEKANSKTIKKADSTTTDHGRFIITHNFEIYDQYRDWMEGDDYGQTRSYSWKPCPEGYKVPSHNELRREEIANRDDAFKKLKLPSSGYRTGAGGYMLGKGKYGYVSSDLPDQRYSRGLNFDSKSSHRNAYVRSNGFPVRCIKKPDVPRPLWW